MSEVKKLSNSSSSLSSRAGWRANCLVARPKYNTIQMNTKYNGRAPKIHYHTIQYNTIQNTIVTRPKYITVQYNTIQYNTKYNSRAPKMAGN